MKKLLTYATCFVVLLWGCNSNKSESHNHDHEHAQGEACNHDHEGHDHDHEGDDHKGHSHGDEERDDDHDHGGHSHAEGDEIMISPQQAKMIGIEVENVEPRTFYQTIKTSGQILAAQGEEKTVVATISGVVSFTKAVANEGKPVTRGESLFNISSSNLVDGDPVSKVRSAYEITKRDFDRAELLIVDKLISQKEYNEIRLAYQNAKVSYDAIAAGRQGKGVNIVSPINGYIKSRLVSEGQFVNVGEPLMVVTQNNKLQLRADVSERYYRDLQNIRSANFKAPYSDIIYKLSEMNGQLLSYGKSALESEFFIPVNFQLNNVGDIIPGSYVEVYLLSGEKENTIAVPKSALIDQQGLFFIYCRLNDEEYERREVQIGATDGDRVEILKGLNVNDKVVVKGAYHVKLAASSNAIPHSHSH